MVNITDPWEDDNDWEEGEPYCNSCDQEVTHGIEGCPEEWVCQFPENCTAPGYKHHSAECSTPEIEAENERHYWWLNFWAAHPYLFRCLDFFRALGQRFQNRKAGPQVDDEIPF